MGQSGSQVDATSDYLAQFKGSSPRARNRHPLTSDHASRLRNFHQSIGCCDGRLSEEFGFHERGLTAADGSIVRDDMGSLLCEEGRRCYEHCAPRNGHQVLQDGVIEGPGYLELMHSSPEGMISLPPANKRVPVGGPLKVPEEFKHLGRDWLARDNKRLPTADEQDSLHSVMVPFVDQMLAGISVSLVLDATKGEEVDAVAQLGSDLSQLMLSKEAMTQQIPVASIRWIRPVLDQGESDSDSRRIAMRLAGGRFAQFRFPSSEQSAFFGTCMRMLAKAAREDTNSPRGESSSPMPRRS